MLFHLKPPPMRVRAVRRLVGLAVLGDMVLRPLNNRGLGCPFDPRPATRVCERCCPPASSQYGFLAEVITSHPAGTRSGGSGLGNLSASRGARFDTVGAETAANKLSFPEILVLQCLSPRSNDHPQVDRPTRNPKMSRRRKGDAADAKPIGAASRWTTRVPALACRSFWPATSLESV